MQPLKTATASASAWGKDFDQWCLIDVHKLFLLKKDNEKKKLIYYILTTSNILSYLWVFWSNEP